MVGWALLLDYIFLPVINYLVMACMWGSIFQVFPKRPVGLIVQDAAILALSFLCFDAASTLAEEAEEGARRIPKAIVLCALIGGLVYIPRSYLGHLVFPNFASFADHQDVASADVMRALGGDLLNSFLTAVFSSTGPWWSPATCGPS